jgi:hypothetical protein
LTAQNRQRTKWLLVSALATAAVAAGCGEDDDGTTANPAPSKDEFIAEADRICAAGDKEIDADAGAILGAEARDERPSPAQVKRIVDEAIAPGVQSQVDDIRALTPPEGDADQIAAFLEAAEAGVAALRDDPERLITDDDPLAEASRLAADYGLEVCGG